MKTIISWVISYYYLLSESQITQISYCRSKACMYHGIPHVYKNIFGHLSLFNFGQIKVNDLLCPFISWVSLMYMNFTLVYSVYKYLWYSCCHLPYLGNKEPQKVAIISFIYFNNNLACHKTYGFEVDRSRLQGTNSSNLSASNSRDNESQN